MAQTKRKRQTKHRGTQAGNIESKGRTSRPRSRAEAKNQAVRKRQDTRAEKANMVPSWRAATIRAAIAAGIFFLVLAFGLRQPIASAIFLCVLTFGLYIVLGYYTDTFLYNRRQRKAARAREEG